MIVKMAIVLTTVMLGRLGTDEGCGDGPRVLVIDVNKSMAEPEGFRYLLEARIRVTPT